MSSRMPQTPEHLSDVAAVRLEADTIILVPGLDGTALLFYRQISLLAERFNVVAFPLPNESDRSMDDLVGELRALIDEIAPRGAILCGESFGGALSLSTALACPEAVRGLVIVNSFSRVPQRVQLRLGPLALRLVPWGAMPLVRRFTGSRLHSPHTLPEDVAEFHERSKQIGSRTSMKMRTGKGMKGGAPTVSPHGTDTVIGRTSVRRNRCVCRRRDNHRPSLTTHQTS